MIYGNHNIHPKGAINIEKQKIEEIIRHWDDWWERRNTEPIYYIIYPEKEPEYGRFAKPWMSPQMIDGWSNWKQEMLLGQALELVIRENNWQYIEEALDLLEYYASITGHAAEGYPFYLPRFGPGMLAACISNFFKFKDFTIWFELNEGMIWERLEALTPAVRAPYADFALEAARRTVKRLKELYIISMPDLGKGLDTLSSLRGARNLLLDIVDYPEKIHKALNTIDKIFEGIYAEFSAIIHQDNPGRTESMRYLSSKPMHISYCDFSAMISPAAFADMVVPMIKKDVERFGGRVVFHLDGPGQLPHLESLCSIDGLFAVQWVPGAGNKPCYDEKHDGLYQKILDKGKRICLSTEPESPEQLSAFFRKFPKREFFVPVTLSSKAELRKWKPA
ncbi:MAG: hypothetical protein ACM3WV_03415 [Bacillota bacterium]